MSRPQPQAEIAVSEFVEVAHVRGPHHEGIGEERFFGLIQRLAARAWARTTSRHRAPPAFDSHGQSKSGRLSGSRRQEWICRQEREEFTREVTFEAANDLELAQPLSRSASVT